MHIHEYTWKGKAHRSADWVPYPFQECPDTAALVPAPPAGRPTLKQLVRQVIRSSPDPPAIGRQVWAVALLRGPCW